MIYCTLFDDKYLPLGVSLIASMQRFLPIYDLHILALNDECYGTLRPLMNAEGNQTTHLHTLDEVIDWQVHPVLTMATSMPWRHFCWAMNAVFCDYLMDEYEEAIFSLDSDTFFFHNPMHLLRLLPSCSVAAPPHRFPPRLKHTEATRGKYNVGGVYFNNDRMGREMCRWWAKQVCERCDEKSCGDQLYWDKIARMAGKRFREMPIGFNMAPWMSQYRYRHEGDAIYVYEDGAPTKSLGILTHFHFHEFSAYEPRNLTFHSEPPGKFRFGLTNYQISKDLMDCVYMPYVACVRQVMNALEKR